MNEHSHLVIADDNHNIKNLELGAGCGGFGRKFYPLCYTTDLSKPLLEEDCEHPIQYQCNAYELPWGESRFDKVIMANPYGYGFNDKEVAERLLSELGRVIINGGEILVVGSNLNRFVNKIKVFVREGLVLGNVTFTYQLEEIDASVVYNGHIFRSITGDEVKPTLKYIINVSK